MTLRTIITALALCIASAPALAQVQCGDTITTRIVMTEDLVCGGNGPALMIDGGTLLMQGHTLRCEPSLFDHGGRDGISLVGRGSALMNGTIAGCDWISLLLTGSGNHTVRDIHVASESVVGADIQSDRNSVTRLRIDAHVLYHGILVSGQHNRISNSHFTGRTAVAMGGANNMLMDNEIPGTYAGASIGGTNHKIFRNELYGQYHALRVGGSRHLIQGNSTFPDYSLSGFQIYSSSTAIINNEPLFTGSDISDANPDCGDNIYRENRWGTAYQDCVHGPRPGRPLS
jgi:hypothetical protein